METPVTKLESTKKLLSDLENDLIKTESELLALSQKKVFLLEEIRKTKEKTSLLETIAFQYEELFRCFENKRIELLSKVLD